MMATYTVFLVLRGKHLELTSTTNVHRMYMASSEPVRRSVKWTLLSLDDPTYMSTHTVL